MSTPGVTSYGDGQAGATLVEMLAALAVVALTLVAAASGLRQLAGSADRGAQVIARHDMFSSGIDVLRRDIERLERVVWKRGENTEFVFPCRRDEPDVRCHRTCVPLGSRTILRRLYDRAARQTATCSLAAALLSIPRQRTFGGCPPGPWWPFSKGPTGSGSTTSTAETGASAGSRNGPIPTGFPTSSAWRSRGLTEGGRADAADHLPPEDRRGAQLRQGGRRRVHDRQPGCRSSRNLGASGRGTSDASGRTSVSGDLPCSWCCGSSRCLPCRSASSI